MAKEKETDIKHVRNIGISAHIDSGKTTLSERVLFYGGKIHKIEEVRGKSGVGATMDFMELEKEKGITIQSAATYLTWKDYAINLIDTPGHVDFTVEVERALRVLDGAVLVLCSVAGVQSQSITVDRQMKRYGVPRLAFINKMDRAGANPFRVVDMLREKLNHNAWMVNYPIGAEDKFLGMVDLVTMKAMYFDGEHGEIIRYEDCPAELVDKCKAARQDLIAALGDFDDVVAEKYLNEEEVGEEELKNAIRTATLSLNFTPVFVGTAFKNKGVQPLLDAVCRYLPSPDEVENKALDQKNEEKEVIVESDASKPFVGLAFKLEDGRYGQLTFMRVYQGTLAKGEFIFNINAGNKKIKVPRIVRMHADEMHDVESARAGDIVALFGVECASGDTFTDGKVDYTMTSMHVPEAVISLAIQPKNRDNQVNFSKALNRFSKEDPTFRVSRDEETSDTLISGMGELHLEIYVERMAREFGVEVEVGKPQVAYRETIQARAELDYTHKKQTGGAGQFAKVVGYMEPIPADSNETYIFDNKIVGGSIPREYIPAVDKGFKEQLTKGLLIGAPVVNVQFTITDGSYHPVDSSEMAFRLAAMAAVRESYGKAQPTILEPIMKVEVSAPEEFQGSVIGQLNQRRGMIMESGTEDKYFTGVAEVPFSEMFGYSTDLRSATQGKGEFSMEFARYAAVPRNVQDEMVKAYQKKRLEESK
ncbi:elongation factor G [bacterium]|nr:elongation factor G [bacterium]